MTRLVHRLLGIDLTAKLLFAHAAIVSLAVVVAWVIARASDDGPTIARAELFGLVVIATILLGVAVSALILRSALAPLRELERVARALELGDRSARVRIGLVHDPQTDRLIAATNSMLDTLEAQRRDAERMVERLAQLSGREMQAREQERLAVARELLEDVAQSCTAIRVGLQGVAKGLSREPLEGATLRARVDGLLELLRSIHDVVQQRALGLRPAGLDDLGLAPALRSAGKRWSSGYGIPVLLDDDDAPAELPSSIEITLFRVAEEAVANAAQHGAPSRVELLLRQSEAGVELRVTDDGRGFDALQVGDRDLGLLAMRERLTLVGGQLRITSRPGVGTIVVAEVPLARAYLAEEPAASVEPLASPN